MAGNDAPPDYTSNYNTNYGNATGAYPSPQFSLYNYPVGSAPEPSHGMFILPVLVARPVRDQLGLAIFACLCCFWPLGVVAIMRALDSREKLANGDTTGAIVSAKESRRYSLISVFIGCLAIAGGLIAVVVILTNNAYYY